MQDRELIEWLLSIDLSDEDIVWVMEEHGE
jgi:hypothetical protein